MVSEMMRIRVKHPKMGLKKMYLMISDPPVGRDLFVEIGMKRQLGVSLPKSQHRTTYSVKSNRYSNLVVDLKLDDINQVWSTDITYFRMGDVFYYIDLIMDVYSRRIIGFCASKTLVATFCVKALDMAIKERGKANIKQTIHHSDKGVQYIFNGYTNKLEENNIQISMCNIVYENAHIERINGIAKNEYLAHLSINAFKELETQLRKFVKLYNVERPHWSLKGLSPVQFEERLNTLPKCQRTKMIIYTDDYTREKQHRDLVNANQMSLF